MSLSEPRFFRHQADNLRGEATVFGDDQAWIAPVAIYEADGFGEEHWLREMPETVLALRLSGAAVHCEWGTRRGAVSAPRANFALQMSGTPNHYRAMERVRFAQVFLPNQFVDRCADALKPGAVVSGSLRPDLAFVPDSEMELRLRNYVEAATGSPSSLEMEARAILIVEHLLRRHHHFAEPAGVVTKGGLAPWQMRRAIEYLHDHLDADISLATLADLVKLSPFHFARSFKHSTGLPPHAYHCALRLDEAKRLLTETDRPITEIALTIGYGAPQTLARVFQRELGTTPSAYRRAHSP